MFRFTLLASFLALGLSGCGEKSPEDIDENLREQARQQKRADAIAQYKRLATEFPASPNAEAAASRARVLESQRK